MADFIVLALISGAVMYIGYRHRRQEKAGLGSCGCHCSGCPSATSCRAAKKPASDEAGSLDDKKDPK